MREAYLIGLDYGSESARGVLIDARSSRQVAYHVHPYRHGIMAATLPTGRPLPTAGFALQDGADYVEAAEIILKTIAEGREVLGIGIDFTASSPLPALADGRALSEVTPEDPHAYVKLWKHAGAQRYADAISSAGGPFLANFGGRVSGEWMLAKAAEIAAEAPAIWRRSDKFIEAGDWLVWRLTGREVRSLDFAAYKAQYAAGAGYPNIVDGLTAKLTEPRPVGSPAGPLSEEWRRRTGIKGEAIVAAAVIDSHVALPAVDAYSPGVLVGALGTSAAYLLLDDAEREMPAGIEGRAYGAALPGLWCYEAGQAAFGDVLAWFVRTFPRSNGIAENFALYNRDAAALKPGQNGLFAIDWWNGNRVPYADKALRGLIAGFDMSTTAVDIYRTLMDSICFGARSIVDRFRCGDIPVERIVLTSGLAKSNPFLLTVMADVLGQMVHVPEIDNPTCVGAAIHGAVAAGVVADFREGADKYGAHHFDVYQPDPAREAAYRKLYQRYCELSAAENVRRSVRANDLSKLDLPEQV